tara:strand:+ start:1369 stop:2199 length:831 start_codon:yes stop_codon:yes gene_type:complete
MAKTQLSDQELKAKIIAKQQHEAPTDRKFPTEIVPIPSKGLCYPKDHPLSSGTVEIKYMTAKDEDILTNNNLLKAGRALDVLYESLLVGNGKGQPVNIDEMLSGDKSALMLATRLLGYGADYSCTFKDDSGNDFEHIIDLNELQVKDVDYSLYKNSRLLDFELPVSKVKVTFKLRTSKEDQILAKEIDQLRKAGRNTSITTTLKHSIVAIDGNEDKNTIDEFIDTHLLAKDSLNLRAYMAVNTPDYNLNVYIDRPEKGIQQEIAIPINTNFFWPRL